MLNSVCKATDAKVVLSTDWRRQAQLKRQVIGALKRLDIEVIGATPMRAMFQPIRPQEILEWLSANGPKFDVTSWVAIDDRDLLNEHGGAGLQGHMVRTHPSTGLTKRLGDVAIEVRNSASVRFAHTRLCPHCRPVRSARRFLSRASSRNALTVSLLAFSRRIEWLCSYLAALLRAARCQRTCRKSVALVSPPTQRAATPRCRLRAGRVRLRALRPSPPQRLRAAHAPPPLCPPPSRRGALQMLPQTFRMLSEVQQQLVQPKVSCRVMAAWALCRRVCAERHLAGSVLP